MSADEVETVLLETADEASSSLLPIFLARRARDKGLEWLHGRLRSLVACDRVADAAAAAACWYSPTVAFWNELDAQPSLAEAYWKRVRIFGKLDSDAWSVAISKFVAAGRVTEAIVLADYGENAVPPEVALLALNALAALVSQGRDISDAAHGTLEYHLDRLLSRVASQESLPGADIAHAELVLSLAFSLKGLPPRLSNELERAPDLFVELLCHLYRAEGDPPPETIDVGRRNAASNAYRLLHAWNGFPGRLLGADRREAALYDWAVAGLQSAVEKRRSAVARRPNAVREAAQAKISAMRTQSNALLRDARVKYAGVCA